MKHNIAQRPNRIPWPPILVVLAVLAAVALDAIWPAASLLEGAGPGLRIAGIAIAGLGIGLDLAAMVTMHRARTNILPHRAAGHLVTGGVFAISRNPIYLGNTLLLLGVAMALARPWLLATAVIAALLVDRLAIRREERHLAARFGQAFEDYMQRVPRWFGLQRRRDWDTEK